MSMGRQKNLNGHPLYPVSVLKVSEDAQSL